MEEANNEPKTILIVYGPNEDQTTEIKDAFWEQLNLETVIVGGIYLCWGILMQE